MNDAYDVLLVEDNRSAVELFLMACEQVAARMRVQVARDGVEALNLLQGAAQCVAGPKLVLLDMKMPRLSGLEVLRQLRADSATAQLAVVVLTASDRESDRREAMEAGADAFESKPMRYQALCELVTRLEARWLHIGERKAP